MGDLAPAPPQRTSDDIGRTPEQNQAARRKAPRKVQPVPPKQQEPDSAPEPEPGHQLDLLA